MSPPCILFANEPRAYREALTGTVSILRPTLEVSAVDPTDLHLQIASVRPKLVVASQPRTVTPDRVPSWLVLDTNNSAIIAGDVAGVDATVGEIDLDGILALLDRATAMTMPSTVPYSDDIL